MPEPRLSDSHRSRPAQADWALVGTAPDQLTAEVWRGLLEAEDIPAILAPGDAVSFLGVSAVPCRLLAPAQLIQSARLALAGELWAAENPAD
jgi:hypothetical protein